MEIKLQVAVIYFVVSIICGVILLLQAGMFSKITPRYSISRYVYLSYFLAGVASIGDCLFAFTEYELINFIEPLAYLGMLVSLIATILYGLSWTVYSEKKQNSWFSRNQKRLALFLVPAFIVILLILSSPFTKLYFYYENGHYQRGPVFLPSTIIILAYCCYTAIAALICSLKKENYVDRRSYIKLFIFAVAILLIQLIQFIFPIMFPFRSLGTMVIFGALLLVTMNDMIGIDQLTQLNNRASMDHYLGELMASGENFGMVILDIDDFKSINDTYGHYEGDRAIKYVSEALTQCMPNSYFLSRFGGDEFVIIACKIEEDLALTEEKINARLAELMALNQCKYGLTVSAGYGVKDDTIKNIPDFMEIVDKRMYQQKQSKKRKRKSKI